MEKAIENLYKAFEKYSLNSNISGSPVYGNLSKWNELLSSKPLRELNGEDLSIYSFKALSTWGNQADFKHFLPRILELLSHFEPEFEEWIVLDKINELKFDTIEQEAIFQYLEVFWKKIITLEHYSITSWEYLSSIANVYPDLNHLLSNWQTQDSIYAFKNLIHLVLEEVESLIYNKTLPGFHNSKEKGILFYDWIISDEVYQLIKENIFKYKNELENKNATYLLQILETERNGKS